MTIDDARFFPILTVPALSESGGSDLVLMRRGTNPLLIRSHIDAAKKVLLFCNGQNSLRRICQLVEADAYFARRLILELHQLGLVQDASLFVTAVHDLTNYPALYPSGITPEEARDISGVVTSGLHSDTVIAHLDDPTEKNALSSLLESRASVRSFQKIGLSRGVLGRLLIDTYSRQRGVVPSAGGLYPLRIYFILTRRQAGLMLGLYQFDPVGHRIIGIASGIDRLAVEFALNSDTLVNNASVIVVVAASLELQMQKYGNRGYRFAQLEAGAAMQNLVLSAADQGLSTLVYGNFNDAPLARLFGMDQPTVPLITIAVGRRANRPCRDAATIATEIKAGIKGDVEHVGTAIEPAGRYQARVTVFSGKTGRSAILGTGMASSADGAYLVALCEAIERRTMQEFGRIDLVRPAEDMVQLWVDPRLATPLTPEQFAANPGLQPFDPTVPWQWVAGSLLDGKRAYVPLDLVTGINQQSVGRLPCAYATSSGVAAHTSRNEAIRRGLLELVERDAFMRHWLLQQVPERISLHHLPDILKGRIVTLADQGRFVEVLNFSNDYGVVVIGVVIHGREYPCLDIGLAASDSNWAEAVVKAFCEADADNGRPTAADRRDIVPADVRTIEDHVELYSLPKYAAKIAWLWSGDYGPPPVVANDIVDVSANSLRPVVVQLSRAGASLQVVRVVCEQLVPISFGYQRDYHAHSALNGEAASHWQDFPIPFA